MKKPKRRRGTCFACGDILDENHECGPYDWAAHTNSLLQSLVDGSMRAVAEEVVARELGRRDRPQMHGAVLKIK